MSRMSETRANVLFFMLVILFAYAVWCVWDRALGPLPVDVSSVQVLTKDVTAGDSVSVLYRIVRHELCGFDSSWVITDAKNRRERMVEPHVAAAGATGPDTFVRDYPVPDDMAPGPASLVVTIAWACPNNIYENLSPKPHVNQALHFNIVPARSGMLDPKPERYALPGDAPDLMPPP